MTVHNYLCSNMCDSWNHQLSWLFEWAFRNKIFVANFFGGSCKIKSFYKSLVSSSKSTSTDEICLCFFIRYIDGGPPAGEPDMSSSIWRRYSEFELLRNYLIANFPAVSKHIMLTLFWYQLIVFGICLSLYFLQQINTSRNSVHLNWIIQKKTIDFCSFWLDWNGLKTPYLEYGRVISIMHSSVKTKMQSTSFDL